MSLLPKRRWLRFSIRTLLVAVTIFCVWLGREWRIVEERKVVRDLVLSRAIQSPFGRNVGITLIKPSWSSSPPPRPSWIRRLMGDTELPLTSAGRFTAQELERMRKAFPEAKLGE
jgi:hypothetical protein